MRAERTTTEAIDPHARTSPRDPGRVARARTDERWDLEQTNYTADVWYTEGGEMTTGTLWRAVENIEGDFAEQNADVRGKLSSKVAPFYERHGHSLNVMEYEYPADAGTQKIETDSWGYSSLDEAPVATCAKRPGGSNCTGEAMLLMGGFNPNPSNDIWITIDGIR